MKTVQSFLCCISVIAIVFTSCQKGYSPDGLVLPGGGNGNTALLVKSEANTTGTTEGTVKTFEYDGSKRVTRINTVETDSFSASISYYYEFVRDTDGKITQIKTNVLSASSPGVGFPAVLTITVHYPTGSSNFDYAVYKYSVSGIEIGDSVAYTYSNNKMSVANEYQYVLTPTYIPVSKVNYSYSGNNVSSAKYYDPTDNSLQVSMIYEFDNKPASVTSGNEGFLAGMDVLMACANNPARITLSVPSASASAVLEYTYQYNAATQPLSGTVIETPVTKTRALKFTYQ